MLQIDCGNIVKAARTETKLVSVRATVSGDSSPFPDPVIMQELASTVGYYPQFVLAASVNNMIDLASVGLIGQKAGFSASIEAQIKQVRLLLPGPTMSSR